MVKVTGGAATPVVLVDPTTGRVLGGPDCPVTIIGFGNNLINVPEVDSPDNTYTRDVVGNKNDTIDGSSLLSFSRLNATNKIITGTSPGTGNTTTRIELDANASAVDGTYDPAMIYIIAGTGAGQARIILEYDGTNKYAYVNREWKVIPDATSQYVISVNRGDTHVNEGKAQGGSNNTITLNALAAAQNNSYLGQTVYIVAGTGQDQSRMIVGYNGGTKVATVDSDWITNPDSTSNYLILPFPGFVHGRPGVNSDENILMRDVIGNKNDYVVVPYSFGDQSIIGHLNTSYYHIHGQAFVYPNHADSVTLTAGAGAWNLTGAITEVIPAATLTTSAFDLHWILISGISANGEIQVDIFSGGAGSEVQIGAVKAVRNTVQSQEGAHRMQIPQQPSGTRISCRLSDSTAGALTCAVSFEGHYYA